MKLNIQKMGENKGGMGLHEKSLQNVKSEEVGINMLKKSSSLSSEQTGQEEI